MSSRRRVGALSAKELRDFRRNRFVILTMAFLPLVFLIAARRSPLFTHPRLGQRRQLDRASGSRSCTC